MIKISLRYALLIFLAFLLYSQQSIAAEFSLFGDIQYIHSDYEQNFVLGALDLIADQEISETSSITADLIFEEDHGGFEMHVERFYLSKSLGENYTFAAGRFQKATGFWHQNFHHGSLAQDTITRPFFIEMDEIEEGIYPAHLTGILLGRESQTSTLYFVVANSSGMNTENIDPAEDHPTRLESLNTHDPSSNKTLTARATYRPFSQSPFEVGLLFMQNNVVETGKDKSAAILDEGETLFEQQVAGVDLSYIGKQFYAFGEFFNLTFEDNQNITIYQPNSDSYNAQAYYVQMGYRLNSKFTVALRHTSLDFDAGNTFFDIQGIVSETRNLIAFKYRPEESNAFRFEVRQEKKEDQDAETIYAAQWFFYLL